MLRLAKPIMENESVDETVSEVVQLQLMTEVSYYIIFDEDSASGAVQIESSPIADYAGTWAPEGSPVTWAAAGTIRKVSIEGASGYGRARISTAIGSGTVSVWVFGQGG